MKYIITIIMLICGISFADVKELIKGFEGFAASPYADRTHSSIGYGTSIARAKKAGYSGKGMISKKVATKALMIAIDEEVCYLEKKIPSWNDLSEKVQSALISMSYNSRALIGPKLKGFIKAKDFKMAAIEIAFGHNPRAKLGLIKRRFKEARLFLDGCDIEMELVTPTTVSEFNTRKGKEYKK